MSIVIGTVTSVATDKVGLWLSLGIVIGAGIGSTLMMQEDDKDNNGQS